MEKEIKLNMEFLVTEKILVDKYFKGNVLDLGCGEGRILEIGRGKPINYTGIDIENSRLVKARKKYPDKTFLKMNAEKLEFPDDSFDVVFAGYNVVDEFINWEDVIHEIRRVLKKDGLFIFSSHNAFYWKMMIKKYEVKRVGQTIPCVPLSIKGTIDKYSTYFQFKEKYGTIGTAYPYFVFINTKRQSAFLATNPLDELPLSEVVARTL